MGAKYLKINCREKYYYKVRSGQGGKIQEAQAKFIECHIEVHLLETNWSQHFFENCGLYQILTLFLP